MLWKPTLLLVLALINTSLAGGPDIDGGGTGDNGNEFVDGTASTDKLIIGATCLRDDVSSTMGTVHFRVYHKDAGFDFSDDSHYMTNDRIEYETCFFIDDGDAQNGDVEDTTCSDFVKEQPTSDLSSNSYESGLLKNTASVNFGTKSDLYCGATYDDPDDAFYYSIYCKREAGHDYDFDVIFRAAVSEFEGDCLVTKITSSNIIAKTPPKVGIEREYEVTSTLYSYGEDAFSTIGGPTAPPGTIVTDTVVTLGTNLIWEICLTIPSSNGPNDLYFRNDSITPIGLYVYNCVATPDTTGGNVNNEGAEADVVDSDGCGTETLPLDQFSKNEYIFQFVADPTVELDEWMRTPNCFRSRGWEAIRFAIRDVMNTANMHLTCKIGYCTSVVEEKCFGATGADYSGMCVPDKKKKRKKRQLAPEFSYLPDEMSITVRIDEKNQTKVLKDLGCFKKTTYIGISSGLGFLSLVVLLIVSVLAFRLWRLDDDVKSSRTTRSTLSGSKSDSMASGIRNKAYI